MELYQDHILDHYHNPRNEGSLAKPTHTAIVRNPSCGDVLCFELTLDGSVVEEIAWNGQGCAISQASASLLSEGLVGQTKETLLEKNSASLLELLQIPLSPGRLKCGILSLEALHTALLSKKENV